MQAIQQRWVEQALGKLPELRALPRGALIDHLPEFLFGLAHWIDGDATSARRGFAALADGHALTRLGHGIDLATLCAEYRILRAEILRGLSTLDTWTRDEHEAVMRLHDGLDFATSEAIRRFTADRELARERFIGILGHDLRNPLHAVILAAAELLGRPCNEGKHARMAATIHRSSERMSRMIDAVIDFAHAHLGEGIPAVPGVCDMGKICEEAAAELRLVHPDRDLRVTTRGDLVGTWDRDRCVQALSNLIGNAIEHGQDPIVVTAEDRGERVTTRVTNTGRAIPADLLPRIFDPFREHSETSTRRKGLGLGLFIVQQIALAHGALCVATSSHDVTTFEIDWPRVPKSIIAERE